MSLCRKCEPGFMLQWRHLWHKHKVLAYWLTVLRLHLYQHVLNGNDIIVKQFLLKIFAWYTSFPTSAASMLTRNCCWVCTWWPSCKRFLLNDRKRLCLFWRKSVKHNETPLKLQPKLRSVSPVIHKKNTPNQTFHQRKKMVPVSAFLALINTLGLEIPTGSRSAISNTWNKALIPSGLGAVIGFPNEVPLRKIANITTLNSSSAFSRCICVQAIRKYYLKSSWFCGSDWGWNSWWKTVRFRG